MNFKRNFNRLIDFKKKMEEYVHLEQSDIKPILNWVKKRQKKLKQSLK